MRYRIVVLILISSLAVPDLDAQMKSGYRFGVNLTSMSIRCEGKYIRPELPVGIQFGGSYEVPVGKKFRFQSGFIFSSKGTDYKIGNDSYSVAPAYLEIPLNSAYYYGRRKVKLSVFAGPYIAGAFGGYRLEPGGELKYLQIGPGRSNDLRCLDAGFNLGAGLNIRNYVFSVQYGLGLRDVCPKPGFTMKNNVIGISISSLMSVNKR